MSTALAIASVTHVLKDLLNDGIINHDITGTLGTTVTVSALPPDRIDTATEPTQLNLFMYQVTFNQGWRNEGLPAYNSNGNRISNPPLALDLHYLLTAYGGGVDLNSEILLGYGMQLIHETPILIRDAIRKSIAPPGGTLSTALPPTLRAISNSGLADQLEQIKVTPESMNSEEMSRLWTAFGTKYRPTAAYKVTVVLIERFKPVKPGLPVAERKLYVKPLHKPVIEKIKSRSTVANAAISEDQKILADYWLVIDGQQLKNENVAVNIEGKLVIPATDDITDTRIIVKLPSGLYAGIQSVQVVHDIPMGNPEALHHGVASNSETFVLSPKIESWPVVNPHNPPNAETGIKIKLNPPVMQKQRIVLFLNELLPQNSSEKPHSYSFLYSPPAPLSPPGEMDTVIIPVQGAASGKYLLRVQVDGAESELGRDNNGRYDSPTVDL